MPRRLEGKIAIITGGSQGYGQGIVTKFRQEGAEVVIGDISDAKGTEVAGNLGCTFVHADVTQQSDWQKMLETAVSQYGGLDIIVNNAGYCNSPTSTGDVEDVDFDKMVDVNMKSLRLSTGVTIPYLLSQTKPAAFVNVASACAKRPRPGLTWYGASKAAIANAVGAMALEYAPNQIRLNTVNPAAGLTNMTKEFLNRKVETEFLETIPLRRFCEPSDVANAVCFLASDEASYITGVALDVDGGRGV